MEQRALERTQQLTAINADLVTEITERERVEAALREANERVKMIFDSITDQFFAFDSDWRFTYLNKHAAEQMKVLGKDPARLIGSVLWDESPYVPNEEAVRRIVSERVAVTDELYYASLGEWVENHMYSSPDGGLVTFQKYITERKREQAELTRVTDELADDLETMKQLHELSTRLLTANSIQSLLEEILSATINLQHADFGNVQLYNPQMKCLEIVVQGGFKQDFLDHFSAVAKDSSACGRALQRGERVIIEDVESDPGFEPHRQIAASAGFRAVQSTPLVSRSGEPLGMLSTHFRDPHRPSEREIRLTDLYARQVAEMLERKQAEEALSQGQVELAHVTHVLTLGELIATIAHEVNQPLGAMVTNGQTCLRLLAREAPDLEKAREVVERMVSDGVRASDVITRIRALLKNSDAEKALLDINKIIQDVIRHFQYLL